MVGFPEGNQFASQRTDNSRIDRMKKPKNLVTPSNVKQPLKGDTSEDDPILGVLKNLDPDLIKMLQQAILDETDLDHDMFEASDAVELFCEYLQICEGNIGEDNLEGQKSDLYPDLVTELSDLKVRANGGDRDAREQVQEIYDLLDEAIENHSIQMFDLVFTGKILSDAAWEVPDSLKQASEEALRSVLPGANIDVSPDLLETLIPLPKDIRNNPFEVHEFLNSIFVAFPADSIKMFCMALTAQNKPDINQAIAGFILHPDTDVANLVAQALATSSKSSSVESLIIERLVRMRPWLPPERQGHVDATIRTMRQHASLPMKADHPKLIKCLASVCDGSGTRSLFVTQRSGRRYQIATVMMKPTGIEDAMVVSDLPKYEMDQIVRQMKSSVPVIETDLAGIARMLELALGDNSVSGKLPPFKLVEVVESLGLGPLQPAPASPIDIISALLADLPSEETDATAVTKAHHEIAGSDFAREWFEAGEAVEDLLYPVRGSKQRVTKLMKTYFQERRQFWARQCAISALVLRGKGQSNQSLWRQLALVGRDIASDAPLDQIPLMQHVAKETVRVFELRS